MQQAKVESHLTFAAAAAAAAAAAGIAAKWWLDSRSLPPGPLSLPFAGSPRMWRREELPWLLREAAKQYGELVSFRLGERLIIAVTSCEALREMLDNPVFAGRLTSPFTQRMTQNCGIIFTEGETWAQQRRVTLRALRDLGFAREKSVEMVQSAADRLMDQLDSLADSGQPVKMLDMLMEASNSVIAQLTFGRHYSSSDPDYALFCNSVRPLLEGKIFNALILHPWLDYLLRWLPRPPGIAKLVQNIQNFIRNQIKARRQMVTDQDAEAACLCDAYFHEQRKAEAKGDFQTFKEHQLVRVCMEIFLAGTDTTARSVEWLLLYCALYPDVQRRIHEELDAICGVSRRPSMSDRTSLHYLLAVIDEGFRKSSLAALGVMHRAVRDTEFRGFRIPSHAIIMPAVYCAHHDEKVWENPDQFNPNRFLDSYGKYQSSKNLIPFLTGRRACPGESLAKMEVFLLFSSIMQRYEFKLSSESSARSEEILRGSFGVLMLPASYGLVVTKR